MNTWLKNFWHTTKTRIHAVVLFIGGAIQALSQVFPTLQTYLPPRDFAYGTLALAASLYVIGHLNAKNLTEKQ